MNAVQAAAVNQMKYSQGTYSAGGDEIDWSYYDTMCVPATATAVRYFINTVGQNNNAASPRAKHIGDTNMVASGQIPKAQNHTVKAIKLFYATAGALATANVQALYTVLKNTVVEFIISNKFYYGQWTLQELLGSASLIALTPTAAGDNIPLIQPRFHGIFPINIPITLAENTNFELKVTYNTTPDASLVDDLLMLSLWGTLKYAT
jgi:hypothetical protein